MDLGVYRFLGGLVATLGRITGAGWDARSDMYMTSATSVRAWGMTAMTTIITYYLALMKYE
jgi:hypothetical protein